MALPLELGGIKDPKVQRALQRLAEQFPITVTGTGGGGTETDPIAGPALATHAALTTTAHGGIVASTDARLSDARTPTTHAGTHQPGGTDPMAVDAAAATGSLRTLGTGAQQAAAGNDARLSDARTPTAHHATHEPGGGDAMAVDAGAATGSLRTLGTASTSAAAGNRGLPTGGTTGQVLAKNTATDFDAGWTTVAGATVPNDYKTIARGAATIGAAVGGASTNLIIPGGGAPNGGAAVALAAGNSILFVFSLDPAWMGTVGTPKMRMVSSCDVGSVGPAVTLTTGLYPVTVFTNTAVTTLGTVVTGSTKAFASPAANSHSAGQVTADFTPPTAGRYVFVVQTSAATAASSNTVITVELQGRLT